MAGKRCRVSCISYLVSVILYLVCVVQEMVEGWLGEGVVYLVSCILYLVCVLTRRWWRDGWGKVSCILYLVSCVC